MHINQAKKKKRSENNKSPTFLPLHIEYLTLYGPHRRHRVQQFLMQYESRNSGAKIDSLC
jgi:hypothetical protein